MRLFGIQKLYLKDEPTNIVQAASARLRSRQTITPNSCDIITITGNEECYIAQFIHHYLYLGFKNIFIGINNCQDNTPAILKKIAKIYPNIFIYNTDQPQRLHRQSGSYAALLNEASHRTKSSHCLVVDIDEYWFSNKPNRSITSYLRQFDQFDLMFTNWLCTYGQSHQTCFTDLTTAKIDLKKSQGKSIFNYSIPLRKLRAHVPDVESPERAVFVSNNGQEIEWMNEVNKLDPNASLPQHLRQVNQSHQDLDKSQNSAWILHQIVRSELEYSLRLFEPRVAKHPEPFKTNRHGWIMPKESRQERHFFKSILSKKSFNKSYNKIYEKFLRQCQIKSIVEKSCNRITERQVFYKINQLSHQKIDTYQSIWRELFQGTRFLPYLELRLQTKKRLKINDCS